MSPQTRAALKWGGAALLIAFCAFYLRRFPVEILTVLTGVMVVSMLLIRRFPAARLRMWLGVLVLLSVASTLVREGSTSAHPPSLPADLPPEVMQLPTGYDTLDHTTESFVVFYGDTVVRLRINFPPVRTLSGLWAYRRARVDGSDALEGSFNADPTHVEPTWGDEIATEEVRETWDAYPYLNVELPLSDAHLHQWIRLRASMRLIYPEAVDEEFFEERSENLDRAVRVFVGSPAERVVRFAYDDWLMQTENVRGSGALALLALGVAGVVLTGSAVPRFIEAAQAERLRGHLQALGLVTAQHPHRLGRYVGLLITEVIPNTPAHATDLRRGDVLIRADDQPITTLHALILRVSAWKPDEEHTVIVLRGPQPMVMMLTL